MNRFINKDKSLFFPFDEATQATLVRRLLPVVTAVIVAFSFLGSRSLYGTSESRYAECGREMAESGQYLQPTMGYRAHWTKPPLTYWAIAGGLNLVGYNEWGARLYNALSFVLTVLIVVGIGTLLYGPVTGNLSGLIYATSLFPVLAAYTVTTDMLLALWVSLAIMFYLRALDSAERGASSGWSMLGFWVALGLGFFTKGPPALLILLSVGIFHARKRPRPRLFYLPGILAFLVLGLWWFITVCLLHPELWGYFLGTEVIGRVASKSVHNHAFIKSFKVYLPALTLGVGLWMIPAFVVGPKMGLFRPSELRKHLAQSEAARFLALWVAVPLVIFMLSSSKLPLYILPIFSPLCIALAAGMVRLQKTTPTLHKYVAPIVILSVILVVGVKSVAPFYAHKRNVRAVYELCKKQEAPDTRFYLFNAAAWGIQFYLDGNVARLSRTGKEPWADGSLKSALNNISAGRLDALPKPRRDALPGCQNTNTPARAVFIYPIWRDPDFPERLAQLKMPVECVSNKFWGVCSVDLTENNSK